MHHDVVILGGGLAGLTLALQLRRRMKDLNVLVLERRTHPLPEAAHKVGESSVEIQAHYLSQVLGLQDYLAERQLKKFGFRFFWSDGAPDLTEVTELGASTFLPTQSYQLDRGMLENDLAQMVQDAGVQHRDGALVRDFTLGRKGERHAVRFEHGGQTHEATADWLVDASGRAGLVKRRLDLAQSNDHAAHAVWFRIDRRIDVAAWTRDAEWLARCNPPNRWLSTNHLVGAGYWVWLIPLASGSHSVGIVADPALHPLEGMNSFDKAMDWLRVHQPQLHADLDTKRDGLQDFAFFKRFSYGCKKVWSGSDRWALTGEAGLFLDPFYSPGGDFIAISNSFVTELVAQDRAKAPVGMLAPLYERIYFSLYEAMLPIYTGQYPLFASAEVMPLKVLWDYTFYWGVMCQLFFQGKLVDVQTMARLQDDLAWSHRLNVAVQDFLRAWGAVDGGARPRRMLDQASLDWFAELNRGLTDRLDEAAFAARLQDNLALLHQLAEQLLDRALGQHPALPTDALRAVMAQRPAAPAAQNLLFPELSPA
nr:tryptophan 7-halogenase [Variovorax boronicumulans]